VRTRPPRSLTGAGPHDLLQMARRGRILDWAGESQYYVEPKRLAMLGYLEARKEPGKTRQRTVYTLTDKGLEALGEWARTPVRFTPLKSEPLLRLLIADLVGEAATRESITTLREDIGDLSCDSKRPRQVPRRCPIGASTCCSSLDSFAGYSSFILSWSTTSSASWHRRAEAHPGGRTEGPRPSPVGGHSGSGGSSR
jgi:DNA-binding PadR family transcriptional regulator